jgi:hypothetical protein
MSMYIQMDMHMSIGCVSAQSRVPVAAPWSCGAKSYVGLFAFFVGNRNAHKMR